MALNYWLCARFGHKWLENIPVRVCKRCARTERQYHIVIPYREYLTGGVLVKCMGRDSLVWLGDTE